MVCKLLKSLYGLKQAHKPWHEKFDKTLTSVGFVVNETDKCVYYRYGGSKASTTRLDIMFIVSNFSRFVSNLGDNHWCALERVLRYVKGAMSFGIHYTGYPSILDGYCDANSISD
ncbi:hypothetical protein U9M48_018823 [Paspalum notatum var. saurae]|uniref:Reverse transcriptase Ty1/copia-type domain-containing protein n=1 Tax=Paspalum notatum var. saurae TaxID=547442 RepID=A0AAQ3TCQ1_PASNO